MADWPELDVRKSVGSNPKQDYFTAETTMPCGKVITRKANGYDPRRVEARARNDAKHLAVRHLKTCPKCEIG